MSNSEDTQILDQNQQDETKHKINAGERHWMRLDASSDCDLCYYRRL